MITASEALQALRDGNKRFIQGESSSETFSSTSRRQALVTGQAPFAIVLGCSDSRVPAEIVFDRGLGDLFVIRVAGNVVAPSQIGSVEFAAEQFGTPLVIILGHSHCGAVKATLDQLAQPSELRSPHLKAIVDRIRPSVEPVLKAADRDDVPSGETLMQEAVRANIRSSVSQLSTGSALLHERVTNGQLVVVGAEYSLESGEVRFLDDDRQPDA
jgi:carbonic anhydrase